jgi:hypothetical protein
VIGSIPTPSVAYAAHDKDLFLSTKKGSHANRGKLIPTKKAHPCAICGDARGDCHFRSGGPLILCAHQGNLLRLKDSILGADGSRYTLFKRGDRWQSFAPTMDRSTPVCRVVPAKKARHAVTTISVQQRHKRSPCCWIAYLHTNDADYLFRRRFTDPCREWEVRLAARLQSTLRRNAAADPERQPHEARLLDRRHRCEAVNGSPPDRRHRDRHRWRLLQQPDPDRGTTRILQANFRCCCLMVTPPTTPTS